MPPTTGGAPASCVRAVAEDALVTGDTERVTLVSGARFVPINAWLGVLALVTATELVEPPEGVAGTLVATLLPMDIVFEPGSDAGGVEVTVTDGSHCGAEGTCNLARGSRRHIRRDNWKTTIPASTKQSIRKPFSIRSATGYLQFGPLFKIEQDQSQAQFDHARTHGFSC